jgi:tetratricopeptide (TPR) repeat protein
MASRKKAPAGSRTADAGWIPSHIFSFCLLTALTALIYANSLPGKFVFDDLQIIQQNSALMNVKTMGDAVSLALSGGGGGWRQLLFLTYALNYYWGGLNPFGYHVVNVSLHAINVLLVYGIILVAPREKEEEERWRYVALGGAAVFAVHTLLSGAVSYIAGRSSVLCATFYFAAIYLFFKGLNSDRRDIRLLYFGFTAVAGWLAWETKQEAITLPIFFAAVVFLRSEKKKWRWVAGLSVIPLLLVTLMWNQIKALYAVTGGNTVLVSAGFEKVLAAATYFRTYVASVVCYFFPRFIAPTGLSVDPQITPVEHWYSSEFLFSVAVLAGLAWLALRYYRREPLLGLAVTAMLVSPLMAYAAIPLADVVLEHRVYIPGLGIAFLFAWIFQWLSRNYSRLRWAAPAALVVIFGFMTVSRNAVFADNIALWEDAAAKAPEKPRPHFNLGQAYQDAQRIPDAIREYEQALALKPDIHAAYSNLAAIYLDQRQLDKGEEMLLKVTSLAPTFTEGFINLAVLYLRKQEPDKALAAINRALELNPESFAAHFNKGEVLTVKGDYKAAIESYKKAVYLRPDLDSFKLALGNAYIRAGDVVSAEKQFHELSNGPVAAEAYRSLALLYNNSGRSDQAMQYFQQAANLRPVFPELHHDMGLVYLRKQMFDEAIEQFRTVLEQQPDHGPAVLNLAVAYQMKGDVQTARQELQGYVEKYSNSNSPYIAQARQKLVALQ